jgi:hypothetical protein
MPYDPKVAQLQQELNAQGYRDPQGKPLAVDGVMGPLTQYALDQRASSTASTAVDPSLVDPMYSGRWATPNISGTAYTAPQVRIEGGNIVSSSGGSVPIPTGGGSTSTPTSVGNLSSQMSSLLSQLQGMSYTPNLPASLTAYNPQIGAMMSSLQAMASSPLAAPETTPQYQAAKARLQREGEEASTRAVQNMAARGILRSSMTESALQNIQRDIVDMLTTQIAPQVQEQLWRERQAELGGLRSDLQTAIDMARVDAERALQLAQMEQQARQFGMTYGLDAQKLMQQAQQFEQQMQWAREQYRLDQELARQKLAQEQYQFDLTYEQKEADRALRERLGVGSLQLQQAAQKLSAARLAQSISHDAYLRQRDLTEQQAQRATQGYLSQILGLEAPEDAFAYIVNNADDIVNDGADISKILSTFRTRYPEFYRNNQLDALLEGLIK